LGGRTICWALLMVGLLFFCAYAHLIWRWRWHWLGVVMGFALTGVLVNVVD
jgi:hypothetical protein